MSINWAAGRTHWTAHKEGTATYSLDHLHPLKISVELAAQGAHPARTVTVHIGFASHVFTRAFLPHDKPRNLYQDQREKRVFDEARYADSLKLPQIIHSLCAGLVKIYFGKHNNFFTIEVANDPSREYRVFFNLQRWKEAGPDAVLLVVQSAYSDCFERAPRGRKLKTVGFRVLLNHALSGTKPSAPAR